MTRSRSILAASLVLLLVGGTATTWAGLNTEDAWTVFQADTERLLDESRALDAAVLDARDGRAEEARRRLNAMALRARGDASRRALAALTAPSTSLARGVPGPLVASVRLALADELKAARHRRRQAEARSEGARVVGLFALAISAALMAMAWRRARDAGRLQHRTHAQRPSEMETLLKARLEELYALRRRTLESDRYVALGEVAAGLSHGLKTPLAAVRARIQTAMARLDDEHAAMADLDEAIAAVDRLIDDIRSFLRASDTGGPLPARVRPGQVLDVIGKSCRELADASGVSLKVDIDAGAPEVVVDPALLEIALRNLVENAVQASSSGRAVLLGARAGSAPARAGVNRSVPGPGAWLDLYVEDEAGGLPDDVVQGSRRGSTKKAGNGLGFSVARRIVERHGGALEAESTDRGTVIHVRLPVEQPEDVAGFPSLGALTASAEEVPA